MQNRIFERNIRRTMLEKRTRIDRQNNRKGAVGNKKRDARRSIRDEYSDTWKNTIARKRVKNFRNARTRD